ncbi:helix-turn-helix domain-containing protein [Loktanella sp. IMCC34160]|uniref:helix-turn-helix domain-containing protein n=1 Tax=Loktanella sp. IMCC34160 TaxID=2510646 RepID=UPI00101BBC66|nr:helix-turn-helix domain-containing protein [Loktanella sp. IMCC34160]RYG92021.1 helix-turn-helix domain-containing protein [Loktanella sp. IMCC34160]
MILKGFKRKQAVEEVEPKGFDAYELRLGDLMRGERATLGKSLLDVQRELKIKAAYIAAIENADPSAFDTPGFIAGYVRSYARYLGMDPDQAFATFCKESGFSTAHGMSAAASSVRPTREERLGNRGDADIFATPATPFAPGKDALLSHVEPGAVGSVLVLVLLIGGLGFGAWTVLQEVQKVQFAPVEQAPVVVADVDPLAGGAGAGDAVAVFTPPSTEALDRLYRPQALDVPVLVSRDGPISTLDPASIGSFAPEAAEFATDLAVLPTDVAEGSPVRVTDGPVPEVQIVAVRPAWVRVRSADGTVIYEGIMEAGATYDLAQTEEPATLRVGESGAIYFAVNGVHYGPAGDTGTITSNLALSVDNLTTAYQVADLSGDADLAAVVNVAEVTTD